MAALSLRLIVGLGNPGPEYALTRHNAGFWFADALARAHGGKFREQRRFQGELAKVRVGDQDIEIFKPLTFMNRGGLAVKSLLDYREIDLAEVLVAHDELDLPVGAVRLKFGGGAGGHNGLKDLMAHLGDKFWRFRFGVGHPGNKDDVLDYVLRRAPSEEEDKIIGRVGDAVAIFPTLLEKGGEHVMNTLHRSNPVAAADEPEDEE
ncbi:MAG TPA: aminoacyl-tRNA hydrolase [Steroidobacteraceae bacterium]|jgi:PTH1 family peptidyl-tRNA hydrolase|nr:aminoacyl-tRNA hydrolase [Steroidobacteraceae bacterium]